MGIFCFESERNRFLQPSIKHENYKILFKNPIKTFQSPLKAIKSVSFTVLAHVSCQENLSNMIAN